MAMTDNQPAPDLDEPVSHKLRRRVAQKVMRDIHRQVDDIQQQEQNEHRAKKSLLPLLLVLTFTLVALVVFWTGALRLLSALIE